MNSGMFLLEVAVEAATESTGVRMTSVIVRYPTKVRVTPSVGVETLSARVR